MRRGWMGVAVAAWLGLVGLPAGAQDAPSPAKAAGKPEPVLPGAPEAPPPNLLPGPPDGAAMPADCCGASPCEDCRSNCGVYVSFGTMALQRQRLGAGAIAVLDPVEASIAAGTGVATLPRSGIAPPPGSPVAQRFNDLIPFMSWGLRGTVGYQWGAQAVECTSFYIFQNDKTNETISPGALDVLFTNAPPGFQGDNGQLFLQNDILRTTFGSSLWSNEINYRSWNLGLTGFGLIAGLRYLQQNEGLSIFTDAEGITGPANGLPVDPTLMATYRVVTHNHILAPQLGGEYHLGLWRWLSVGGFGKVALGANFIDAKTSLVRGDGLEGFRSHFQDTNFGQIYEIGAFVDVHLLERLYVRAGYNALWLVGIATAVDQVSFDLGGANAAGVPPTLHGTSGSTLYHGPLIELRLLF